MLQQINSWRTAFGVLAILAAGGTSPLQAQVRYSPQAQAAYQQQILRQQIAYQQWLVQQQMRQAAIQQQAVQQQTRLQQQMRQAAPVVVVPVPVVMPVIVPAGESQWTGSEDLQGYGELEFRFRANGRVTMIDADGPHAGTFTSTGNRVTLRFHNGAVVYSGTIDGETLTGTATNGKTNWTFTVSQ
jgi:hypothetical protein